MTNKPGFDASATGFRVTFANGVTVSVQFGHWNYCSNRRDVPLLSSAISDESPDAETAVFIQEGHHMHWLTREYDPTQNDDVMSYQTPAQVLALMAWAEKRKG